MDSVSNYISNKLREYGYHISPETIQDMISTGIGLTGMSPESLTSYVIEQITGSVTSRLGFGNHNTIPVPNDANSLRPTRFGQDDIPQQPYDLYPEFRESILNDMVQRGEPDIQDYLSLSGINLSGSENNSGINFENNSDSGNNIPPPTNNNENNNMSQAPLRGTPMNSGAAMAGAGKGDPTTNFHALGTQDAGDTYDVGYIKAERDIQPAETVKFKMHYTPNMEQASLTQPGYWVFSNTTPMNANVLDTLMVINLNHGMNHIPVYSDGTIASGYWRSPNDMSSTWVAKRWNEYANKYNHYKVLKTKVTISIKHLGDASYYQTGMPFRLFGWRENSHNRVMSDPMNLPTTVGAQKESPFGFQISDFIYPKFCRRRRGEGPDGEHTSFVGYTGNVPSEYTYTYTYSSEDATTTVDLDGDMNNKSMWAATDSVPPDEQKLSIQISPMFRTVPTTNPPTVQDFQSYGNASAWVEVDIEQIVQFRDIKYEAALYHNADVLNVTNPI